MTYIKVGSFSIQIRFWKCLVPILKFKEFTLGNIIATKATFRALCCLFVEKFEEHKSLFKLDGCLLANILRFGGLLTFGSTFGLLGLYVDISTSVKSSLFFNYLLRSSSWGVARDFSIPISTIIFGILLSF